MGFLELPLIRLGFVYLTAILLSPLIDLQADTFLWTSTVLFIVCLFSSLLPIDRKLKSTVFGPVCVLLVFSLGLYAVKARELKHNITAERFLADYNDQALALLTINRLISETDFYLKYEADALSIDKKTKQKLLVKLKKDSLCQYLNMSSQWLYNGKLSAIPTPKNPHDFDYAAYMKLGGISLQISASKQEFIAPESDSHDLKYLPGQWQQTLVGHLRKLIKKPQHYELLAALLFGDKSDLSTDTKRQFATAGVMHLLAVSGLHVGIVMLFARWLFGFVRRLPYGRHIQSILVLLVVWAFALITGASVSVLRAATLFSFLICGQFLGGRGSSMNSLFGSMWLLLLINPLFAYQIGFQLSYLAVFYILWLMPGWSNLYNFKNMYLKKGWQLIGLSLIAQLATAPLSIYYFHSFPTYFLLSNLVLLPFMSALLIWGFISVLLVIVFPFAEFLLTPLEYGIEAMIGLTKWVEALPAASLAIPHFDDRTMLLLLFTALLISYLLKTNRKRLIPFASFCSVCLLFSFRSYTEDKTHNELILSHQFGRTQLIHQQGRAAIIYENDSETDDYTLKLFTAARNIKDMQKTELPLLFEFKAKRVLIVDGSYAPDVNLKEIDAVLLTNNAAVHLERWIQILKPKLLIADGSSFPNVKARWAETAKKRRLPFYDTSQKGAFIFE